MKALSRFIGISAGLGAILCMPAGLLAQNEASANPTAPGYARMPPVPIKSIRTLTSSPVLTYPAGARTSRGKASFDENGGSVSRERVSANAAAGANSAVIGNGTLFGLDTVPTFEGAFAATGGPNKGTVYPYIMIGNDPLVGGTTTIPAKITTVALQLLNPDGSVNKVVSYNPFESTTLDSPVFQNVLYGDGRTQFTDAIQRAEFFNTMKQNWHTRLDPSVVNRITVTVPRFVNVRLPDGTVKQVQNYYLGTAPNGDPFVELLDLFFNSVFDNAVINDINDGNDTTDAFNMQLYPNTLPVFDRQSGTIFDLLRSRLPYVFPGLQHRSAAALDRCLRKLDLSGAVRIGVPGCHRAFARGHGGLQRSLREHRGSDAGSSRASLRVRRYARGIWRPEILSKCCPMPRLRFR